MTAPIESRESKEFVGGSRVPAHINPRQLQIHPQSESFLPITQKSKQRRHRYRNAVSVYLLMAWLRFLWVQAPLFKSSWWWC